MSEGEINNSKITTFYDANSFLQMLVGQPLLCSWKFPYWDDLFEIGFGNWVCKDNNINDLLTFPLGRWLLALPEFSRKGRTNKGCEYAIHAMCPIKVIWRKGKHKVKVFDENTSPVSFYEMTKSLTGMVVKRVSLSPKNDLWIDLDAVWIVIVTNEDEEESWRFIPPKQNEPHLVVASTWYSFDY